MAHQRKKTSSTRANTRANDKWAQEGTRGPKGEVGGPTGRPADQAHGPHCLKSSTCQLLIGCRRQFGEAQLLEMLPLAVAPSYKYKGGEKWNTHHTTQLNSPFSLGA